MEKLFHSTVIRNYFGGSIFIWNKKVNLDTVCNLDVTLPKPCPKLVPNMSLTCSISSSSQKPQLAQIKETKCSLAQIIESTKKNVINDDDLHYTANISAVKNTLFTCVLNSHVLPLSFLHRKTACIYPL